MDFTSFTNLENIEKPDKSAINSRMELSLKRIHSKTDALSKIRKKIPNHFIIGHFKVNSIWNKLEIPKEIIGNNIDVLLISERKLDDTFCSSQFILEGFESGG